MTDTETEAETEGEPPEAASTGSIDQATDVVADVIANVEQVMIGQRPAIEHVLVALLGRGHVLLEDVPGVGKTMLARAIADSFDGEFKRVQFTPDLLPSDVTGVNVFNQKTQEFDFRPGPVFADVVLGDEINRAPPKTQSALLEAMEESQVTVDGETHQLSEAFTVIATQNTVEGDRAYDLPMAQIDRFMKKVHLGYPDGDEETQLLERVTGRHPIEDLEPVASLSDLRNARRARTAVTVTADLREYVTRLVSYTREEAQLGASPRAGIALLRAAQGRALLSGRDYAIPEDVKSEAETVLSHRIRTADDQPAEEFVADVIETVEVE